jgi:hypothetical protein
VFGRRKDDEDPFAALKDGGTYTSSPLVPDIGIGDSSPLTPPTPTQPQERALTQVPERVAVNPSSPSGAALASMLRAAVPSLRRRTGIAAFPVWRIVKGAIVLLVVVPIVISVIAAVLAVHHATTLPSITSATPVSPVVPNGSTSPASYLAPAGLRAGLAHVARVAPRARLSLLRVDANSLTAIVALPNGHGKEIYFGPSTTAVLPERGGAPSIPISRIHPAAVARIERDLSVRFHVAPRAITSMILGSLGSLGVRWTVLTSVRGPSTFTAALSGAHLRRFGT